MRNGFLSDMACIWVFKVFLGFPSWRMGIGSHNLIVHTQRHSKRYGEELRGGGI